MALEAERGGSLFLLVQGGRLRRRLTPALGGQKSILCPCLAFVAFWLRIGCAGHVVSGWPALSSVARLVVRRVLRALAYLASSCFMMRAVCATWRSSSAVRSSHAGHNLRGIAELSKQRYRVAHRRRSVLPYNQSFKRTASPPLNSSVRPQGKCHGQER